MTEDEKTFLKAMQLVGYTIFVNGPGGTIYVKDENLTDFLYTEKDTILHFPNLNKLEQRKDYKIEELLK